MVGKKNSVTVIGAGIVGLCSARYLQLRGWEVTLLDRLGPAQACSFGNAGLLSIWSLLPISVPGLWKSVPRWLLDPVGPLHVRWRYLPQLAPWFVRFFKAGNHAHVQKAAGALHALNSQSIELYQSLLRGSGHEQLIRESGYLHVYRRHRRLDLDDPAWRLRREHGARLQVLRQGEVREHEPALSDEYTAAVRISPMAYCIDPGGLGLAIADLLQRDGARFVTTTVQSLRKNADGQVTLLADDGEHTAQTLVVAAGAWSARLLETIGWTLPLESERGYHTVFAEPGVHLADPVLDTDHQFVATSMRMGLRCAGTDEFASLDAPPDWRRARMFERLAKRMLPSLHDAKSSVWMGQRPALPDSLPVIGRLPGHANLLLAFGHGHLGLTQGAPTGRLIAQLATGETPNIGMQAFAPQRFS